MRFSQQPLLLSISALGTVVLSLAPYSRAHAETAAFQNNFLSSPSIVSPSQHYQLKDGATAQVELEFGNRKVEFDDGPELKAEDAAYGLAAFAAQSPSLVWGFKATQREADVRNLIEQKLLDLAPSLAFSPTENFTVGGEIHSLSDSVKLDGGSSDQSDVIFGKLGATYHVQDLWEASAYVSNRAQHDGHDQPQIIGAHGRYKILDPLTLGLSVENTFFKEISSKADRMKDETRIGVHLETLLSKDINMEAAYFNRANPFGLTGSRENELEVQAQYAVNTSVSIGAKLGYKELKTAYSKERTLSEGLFLAARF